MSLLEQIKQIDNFEYINHESTMYGSEHYQFGRKDKLHFYLDYFADTGNYYLYICLNKKIIDNGIVKNPKSIIKTIKKSCTLNLTNTTN